MYKLKEMILMLCLILSGALCYAHDEAKKTRMENKNEGHPVSIVLKESTGLDSSDRSSSINPIINDNILTVVFSENLGQVSVEVATAAGATIQTFRCLRLTAYKFTFPMREITSSPLHFPMETCMLVNLR